MVDRFEMKCMSCGEATNFSDPHFCPEPRSEVREQIISVTLSESPSDAADLYAVTNYGNVRWGLWIDGEFSWQKKLPPLPEDTK